jgi:hypothetical protein
MVFRHYNKRMDIVVAGLTVIQIKNYVHVINLQGAHTELVYQCFLISVNQIFINMLTSKKFAILTTILSIVAMVLKLHMVQSLEL